ncbi:FUSC family protein [Brachybacterium sp.]|uniref:FUSC family protein n=1 Tax=Brachybacterium sp. TaxID=1891286 RepID=UPI002ED08D81
MKESDQHQRTRGRPARLAARLAAAARSPEVLTDLLQILKAVTAATAAWWFADVVLDSEIAFLAPWTALLTVHATVYRSMSRGVQTTLASGLGVLVSFLIGHYLGVGLWTFALALLVGMCASRITWIRDEGVAVATTAIFVLGSGFGDQKPLLLDRLVEVAIGVAFGIVVNLLLVPPLRHRQAARHVDSINQRMGRVLVHMAEQPPGSWDLDRAEEWTREITRMDEELDSAWSSVRFARESDLANPRRRLAAGRARGPRGDQSDHRGVGYEEILSRVDEGISHLRNLARTLREASQDEAEWDESFREQWRDVVRDAGVAISDPDAEVEPVHERLRALAARMAEEGRLPRDSWPVYGALIRSMQHIAVVVDDVASARRAREAGSENPQT